MHDKYENQQEILRESQTKMDDLANQNRQMRDQNLAYQKENHRLGLELQSFKKRIEAVTEENDDLKNEIYNYKGELQKQKQKSKNNLGTINQELVNQEINLLKAQLMKTQGLLENQKDQNSFMSNKLKEIENINTSLSNRSRENSAQGKQLFEKDNDRAKQQQYDQYVYNRKNQQSGSSGGGSGNSGIGSVHSQQNLHQQLETKKSLKTILNY